MQHVYALGIAYILDFIIGDPKHWPHPVKAIGGLIQWLDKRWNRGTYRKVKGVIMIVLIIIIVFSISFCFVSFVYSWNVYVGIFIEGVLISTTIAQKSLKEAAIDIAVPLKQKNVSLAKEKLSYIVGRDTKHLKEQGIVRGTVETVAENTSDGITAPLLWGVIGGAPLALVYRAINTCDSMVGYTNDNYAAFGWASAKIDDLVNWVPARLTGWVMIFVVQPEKCLRKYAINVFLRDQKNHQSPNSGWGEAAVAALLGVQLGGINYYQGERSVSPTIGDALQPLRVDHIDMSISVMQRTVTSVMVLIIVGGLFYGTASAWL